MPKRLERLTDEEKVNRVTNALRKMLLNNDGRFYDPTRQEIATGLVTGKLNYMGRTGLEELQRQVREVVSQDQSTWARNLVHALAYAYDPIVVRTIPKRQLEVVRPHALTAYDHIDWETITIYFTMLGA